MVTTEDVRSWVEHWLKTPVNGYFGSGYGADVAALLFAPLSDSRADAFLNKMKRDIPMLTMLNDNQLSIQAEQEGFEVKRLYIRIGSILIDLGSPSANATGDSPRGNTF